MDGKGERLLILHNVGSADAPPNCPLEMLGIEGTAEPIHKVRVPATASIGQVLINGESTLYAGSYTTITDSWPKWSSFSGDTQPDVGDEVGVVAGTLGMSADNTGFICLALHGTTSGASLATDGSEEGRILVRPYAAGGGGGPATLLVVQATADGASGVVVAKTMTLKADVSATPNYDLAAGTVSYNYYKA